MAARTCIPSGQYKSCRQLVLYVEVELLNSTLFEIEVLRLISSSEILGIHGRCKGRQERRSKTTPCRASETAGLSSETCEWSEAGEIVRLSEIRRILPQSLRALIPRGIVEDRIPQTNSGFLRSKWFPRDANPRLHGSLV